MWWEIIPSFAIIVGVGCIPPLAMRAINRLMHDGNPMARKYETDWSPQLTHYWRRDVVHSEPSFWQKYIKSTSQGPGTIYKCHGLEKLD